MIDNKQLLKDAEFYIQKHASPESTNEAFNLIDRFIDALKESPSKELEQEEESAGHFLKRLGTDGMEWAKEMHKRFPEAPLDDLLGWCCNMIEIGRTAGEKQLTSTQQALTEAVIFIDKQEVLINQGKEIIAMKGKLAIRNQNLQQALGMTMEALKCIRGKLEYYENIGRSYMHPSDVAKDIKKIMEEALKDGKYSS